MTPRTVDPPVAPPGPPTQVWTVQVPEPAGRGAFSFAYRIGAGIIAAASAGLVVGVVGVLNGWRASDTVLAVEGIIVLVLTAVSERLLKSVYERYHQREVDRGRQLATEELIRASPSLGGHGTPMPGGVGWRIVKRALDIVVATILLVLIAPMLMLISLLVRLESPGPALFKQERVGRNGRSFYIFKFRTMTTGAESTEGDWVRIQASPRTGGLFSPDDDPRVTRAGRLLRRTALDDLPQLINVLKGDMSLVGPRPRRPGMIPFSARDHDVRRGVRPGITGLAQVSVRGYDREAVAQADWAYVMNWSIWLDLKILWRTVIVAFRSV